MGTTRFTSTTQGWWFLKIVFCGLLFVSFTACGSKSKSPSNQGGGRGSGDVLRSLTCGGEPSAEGDDGSNLALMDETERELRHVPAEDLLVLEGKAVVSFCDIMRANSEAKLSLFMFASPSCFKCQKWIELIGSGLIEFGNTVLPVVVFSETKSKFSDADLDALKEQVAPDMVWVRDPEKEVWSFFAPEEDPQKRVTPLLLEMDSAARGFIVEDTVLEAKDLVNEAERNLGLDLGGE